MANSFRTTGLFAALVIVVIVAVVWQDEKPAPKPILSGAHRTKKPSPEVTVLPEDYEARFEPVTDKLTNHFEPLIKKEAHTAPVLLNVESELTKIPSKLADGEGDWTYHGLVKINEQTMALLESVGKKQSGYVELGEKWKSCTVTGIEPDSISLEGQDGKIVIVKRFTGDEPKKPTQEVVPVATPAESENNPLSGPLPRARRMESFSTKMGGKG